MGRFAYYAVYEGHNTSKKIYTNWTDAKVVIDGYPNAKFKGFMSKAECNNYFNSLDKKAAKAPANASTTTTSKVSYGTVARGGNEPSKEKLMSSVFEVICNEFKIPFEKGAEYLYNKYVSEPDIDNSDEEGPFGDKEY